jgi:hypothetical protein
MSKVIKAIVKSGRYQGQTVRVTNVSADELGRRNAACLLSNGMRANIRVDELEVIQDTPEPEPSVRRAKTASMPFISGSTSSRSLTHTKNMSKNRVESKNPTPSRRQTLVNCESCGAEYNLEERKGMPGKITECENCAEEVENKAEGKMIFSHKTGATIEIKKEAQTFNYKDNKD